MAAVQLPIEFSDPSRSANPVLQEKINKLTQEWLGGMRYGLGVVDLKLQLDFMNITSLDGIAFVDEIVELNINRNPIASLENVRFPRNLKTLRITDSQITSLRGINWPENLIELNIDDSRIATLEGVIFPPTLNALRLNGCNITTLEGVIFPVNLAYLVLTRTGITSLKGAIFPNKLIHLMLNDNQIASFEGMKFPPLLSASSLQIKGNPIDPATVSLLERPTEAVKRAIIRDYPETAQYFEAQGEIKEVAMRNLQNHVRSIAQFLQPLIAERKANEEATLAEGKPRLVVNTPNGVQYTIPFTPTLTIQEGAIDYLERNYLLSVMNSWDKVDIIYRDAILDPNSTFAHSNIESEATLNLTGRKLSYQGGRKKTKYNRLKIKKRVSRKHK
jgi:hypothetical protein